MTNTFTWAIPHLTAWMLSSEKCMQKWNPVDRIFHARDQSLIFFYSGFSLHFCLFQLFTSVTAGPRRALLHPNLAFCNKLMSKNVLGMFCDGWKCKFPAITSNQIQNSSMFHTCFRATLLDFTSSLVWPKSVKVIGTGLLIPIRISQMITAMTQIELCCLFV